MNAIIEHLDGTLDRTPDIFEALGAVVDSIEAYSPIIAMEDAEAAAHALMALDPLIVSVTLIPEGDTPVEVFPVEADYRQGFGDTL